MSGSPTSVLLINVRTAFTNQTRTCEIRADYSTSTKVSNFQKEVKKTKPLCVHNNSESHFKDFLPEMGASWEGAPHSRVSTVATLEEETIAFAFIACARLNLWKKLEKAWSFMGSEKFKSFVLRRGFDSEIRTIKRIDCWKTWVFYRHFNGWDTRRISRAQFEQDTRPTRRSR